MRRPKKYKNLIRNLDEDVVYSPATIAAFALEHELLKEEGVEIKKQAQRVRIAMGNFSNQHDFPDQGDDMVYIRGQSPKPGWYGWRWKNAYL